MSDRIERSFGAPPRTYLAGRYGFGPNTADILEDLGYEVDISPAVPIDFSADGGPDYSAFTSHPSGSANGAGCLVFPAAAATWAPCAKVEPACTGA